MAIAVRGATMPLNPYVAWMYQQYGQLDEPCLGFVRHLGESASFIRDQCYIGSVVLSDQLRKSFPDRNIPAEVSDAIRTVLVDSVLSAVWAALQDTIAETERRDLLIHGLQYEITGEIPAIDNGARWPPSQTTFDGSTPQLAEVACQLGDLCTRAVGRPLSPAAFEGFNGFVAGIVNGVIGPTMRGQSRAPVPLPHFRLVDSDAEAAQGGEREPEPDAQVSEAHTAQTEVVEEAGSQSPFSVNPQMIEPLTVPSSTSPASAMIAVATFKRRLAAYVLDYAIVFFIGVCIHFVAAFASKPIPDDSSSSTLLFLAVLLIYMVVAQAWRHTTIGKYAVGIEVRSDNASRQYPSFWRILLRETVGRICSFVFWGAGYWTCIGHPKKQAWSDRMASTVVVVRPTNRVLKQAFGAFLSLVILLDIGVSAYGAYYLNMKKRQQEWLASVQSQGSQIETSRQAIETVIGREVKDWDGYKSDMREMLGLLDKYDRDVASMKALIVKGLSTGLVSSGERLKMEKILDLWELRQRQSAKRREEAEAVLSFYPGVGSWPSLKARLEMLDSDIEGLDTQANRLARELGLK
jgi:uncharacterized RDD family membrane protein YckC